MAVESLTAEEKLLIGRCLYEAANGEYFPDWEFQTLIGVDRQEVRKAASSWLTNEVIPDEVMDTTRVVLNNLLGYPHGREADLERATGVNAEKVAVVFGKVARPVRTSP
jgi:hypothetical protein